MKKLFLFIAIALVSIQSSSAQQYSENAPYISDSTIPNFTVLQPDSSSFDKSGVPKDQPFVIIYFNPDCGHCQVTAQMFAKQSEELKNVTFLWVTYLSPLDSITAFAQKYKLAAQPNIHFGKDLRYFIPSFFRIEYTPYIAAYSAKGKLLRTWPMGTTPNELKKELSIQ